MNPFSINEFGMILREKRKLRGISQEQLANILGVTKSTISKYELGLREPSFSQLQLISEALNVDIYELLTGESKEIYFQSAVDWIEFQNRSAGYCYTEPESRLVSAFDRLNEDGQEKAIERVQELTEIQKYQARKAEISDNFGDLFAEIPKTRENFISSLAMIPNEGLPIIAEHIVSVCKDPAAYLAQSEEERAAATRRLAEQVIKIIERKKDDV